MRGPRLSTSSVAAGGVSVETLRASRHEPHTLSNPHASACSAASWRCPGSNPGMFEKARAERGGLCLPRSSRTRSRPMRRSRARKNIIAALNDIDWSEQDRVGAHQRDRHPLHVSRCRRHRRAGRPQARYHSHPQGRRAGGHVHGRRDGDADRDGQGLQEPHRARGPDRDGARHGQRRGHRVLRAGGSRPCISASPIMPRAAGRAPSTSAGSIPIIRATSGTRRCRAWWSPAAPMGCAPSTARSAISTIPTAICLGRQARRGARLSRASGPSIPRQIALANQVMSPPEKEVTRAKRILDGLEGGRRGRQGRRPARWPDDRRGLGAHGREHRQHR